MQLLSQQRTGSVVCVVEPSRMLLTGLNFLAVISITKVNVKKGHNWANGGCENVHITLPNFIRVGGTRGGLRSGDLGQRDSPS